MNTTESDYMLISYVNNLVAGTSQQLFLLVFNFNGANKTRSVLQFFFLFYKKNKHLL